MPLQSIELALHFLQCHQGVRYKVATLCVHDLRPWEEHHHLTTSKQLQDTHNFTCSQHNMHLWPAQKGQIHIALAENAKTHTKLDVRVRGERAKCKRVSPKRPWPWKKTPSQRMRRSSRERWRRSRQWTNLTCGRANKREPLTIVCVHFRTRAKKRGAKSRPETAKVKWVEWERRKSGAPSRDCYQMMNPIWAVGSVSQWRP